MKRSKAPLRPKRKEPKAWEAPTTTVYSTTARTPAAPQPKDGGLYSPKYLAFVRSLPCIVCGIAGVDAHHYPSKGASGVTRDDRTAPLCRKDHDLAQRYEFAPVSQEWWVKDTFQRFFEQASMEQVLAYVEDWKRWRASRVWTGAVPW